MAMCKEVGACPVPAGENVDCNCFGCSGFDKDAYASANDGIMTWPELLDHMENLGDKWEDAIKTWNKDYTLLARCGSSSSIAIVATFRSMPTTPRRALFA